MKKYLKQLLIVALTVSASVSCKKEESKHPEVQTAQPSITAQGKVLFRGSIVNKGTYKILDYGFVYGSSPELNDGSSTKISLGSELPVGDFQTESEVYLNNYNYNRTLYTRAYVTNDKGTAYGDSKSVNLPVSSASNLSPASGGAGDTVFIFGQFFTDDPNRVFVTFANKKAVVVAVTATKITVIVPDGINSQSYYNNQVGVSVSVNGQQLGNNYTFTISPKFTSFSPKTGTLGSAISIYGANIPTGYTNGRMRLYLGAREITNFYANNSSEIRITVPDDIPTEKFKISVVVDGITTILPDEFTVNLPTINSVSSTTGLAGSLISLVGVNFPTNYNTNNKIKIGGTIVTLQNLSPNSVSFNIPNTLAAGDYDIELIVGAFTIKAPQKFKVKAPTITSFSPAIGGVSQEVNVIGDLLPNTYYTISIGSVNTNASTTSTGALKFFVPFGASLGKTKITLTVGGTSVVSAADFTVTGPEINSFSPKSGVAGTVVTIDGIGFISNFNGNIVKFGTVATQVLTVSGTRLTVSVPSNINPSSMKISVSANGQTVVSTDNFTIIN